MFVLRVWLLSGLIAFTACKSSGSVPAGAAGSAGSSGSAAGAGRGGASGSSNDPAAGASGQSAGAGGHAGSSGRAAYAELSEPCPWSPLRCSDAANGCSCERACEGSVYTMACDSAQNCSCSKNGAETGTATTTCGDAFAQTTSFSTSCGFPGVAYTRSTGGSPACATAGSTSAFIAAGCFYSKVCDDHSYAVRCPAGYPCYCATDGIWTGPASANCTDANSLANTYTSACGYP